MTLRGSRRSTELSVASPFLSPIPANEAGSFHEFPANRRSPTLASDFISPDEGRWVIAREYMLIRVGMDDLNTCRATGNEKAV